MERLGDSHITGYADMHTSTSTKYDNKLVCNINIIIIIINTDRVYIVCE